MKLFLSSFLIINQKIAFVEIRDILAIQSAQRNLAIPPFFSTMCHARFLRGRL